MEAGEYMSHQLEFR